jgi:hypothetical protein
MQYGDDVYSYKNHNNNKKKAIQSIYTPLECDSLFWALYICKYSKTNYNDIDIICKKNIELQEKDNIIVWINENKELKMPLIQKKRIISILLTENTIIEIINIICQYYEINVYLIDKTLCNFSIVSYFTDTLYYNIIYINYIYKKFSIDLVLRNKEYINTLIYKYDILIIKKVL